MREPGQRSKRLESELKVSEQACAEEQFRFYGDLLFGCWRLRGQRISVRYLESHENEFEWFPHSYNALMLMPWRDGQPLNYEESMGEA